jgi:hypothetical protein
MFACIILFIKRYDFVVSSSEKLHLNRLGTCSSMHMTKQKSQLSLDDLLCLRVLISFFMPILILFCRKHDYDSYCSLDCRFPVFC